jgi:hypothetical protein
MICWSAGRIRRAGDGVSNVAAYGRFAIQRYVSFASSDEAPQVCQKGKTQNEEKGAEVKPDQKIIDMLFRIIVDNDPTDTGFTGESATDLAVSIFLCLKPAGYAIVPLEPTQKMVDALNKNTDQFYSSYARAYKAAVRASQEGE